MHARCNTVLLALTAPEVRLFREPDRLLDGRRRVGAAPRLAIHHYKAPCPSGFNATCNAGNRLRYSKRSPGGVFSASLARYWPLAEFVWCRIRAYLLAHTRQSVHVTAVEELQQRMREVHDRYRPAETASITGPDECFRTATALRRHRQAMIIFAINIAEMPRRAGCEGHFGVA